MTILCNELTLEQVNAALLRIQRSIQSNTNNFQNDVEKAVANVTVQSKNTTIHYDDSKLWNVINTIQNDIKNIKITDSAQDSKIANLEALMASINFDYDPDTKVLTLQVGSKTTEIQLIDTTYTFAYDSTTSKLTVTDNITQSAVFDETIVGTTYTFSFTNGILTAHNNLLNTDQTFNFDSRYYTESEIQSLILDKIPPEASASNQLADKSFVNSSISTATATFRGTVTTTQALAALTGDLNDYAYLQNIDPTTGQTISYDRYKWVESGGDYGHWKYEYTLNNSSFTSDQWAAINSGITCQIVQDLLDGCYSGNGSALCKSAGNEWRNLLSTNCNCTGSVDADYIYYNTNIQANQCTGALLANCYCVYNKGWVPFTRCSLTASSLGLTAGCTYPLTCILDLLRCCFGSMPATYVFLYANAQNPIICETGGHAYCLSFTKLDAINVTNSTWQRDHWLIEDNVTGKRWTASSYSTATVGSWTWDLNSNKTACQIYRNVTCDNANFPLFFAGNNTAGFGSANVSGCHQVTFNPSTGILNVACGTCIGGYRTKSYCVKVTPAAQSSCWIYIGRFQTNGTADTTNTYNELNLTIAAVGNSMVSSANIKVSSANAASPTVTVQRQAGYSTSTGIDCVVVTRSGSVWNCYVCVWARVKSYGTNAYFVHLYRNMLPDTWTTALTVCSAITGDVVGVGNVGINSRAIQSNADLRIGSLTACTSTVAGCSGSIYGSGYMELFAPTPFIACHVNNAGADYSSKIIASTGSLGFNVNNATGCTASTESAGYTMCSNGLLYSGKGFVAGCINAACPFLSINCGNGNRILSMTRATGADVGLLLSHCADWTGTTYCNLGIEIGTGNVNRGFYHYKAGTFEWLQYWDATCERHACPQCFACPIYGCSSATFAGTVSACNTERWSTVYSSNTYSTGYYLIAEYKTNENGAGNHDITIGGCVDVADTNARKPLRFKASIRGNKCTVNYAYAWVDSSLAADYLAFTRSVDTATCTFDLRIYAKISSYYTRFNTTIDYLAAGDVNLRKSNYLGCLTFPNTYAADTTAFVGTIIPPTCSCGVVDASYYKTCALSISCTFAANSTSYILLGCYTPSNIAGCANELDLGVALGGGNLVEKGSLKLLLTTASCSATCFSNNNIEAKFSNYVDSCYGVRNLIFTSSGNSWSCSIGIWLQVCNPSSAACTWAIDLLRNKIDSRFTSSLTCATATSGTRVCTIAVPAMRNFYFNNAEQNCFACVLSTSILCTSSFRPLPSIICGNCTQCYIHLGCYKPTLLCANELDLTLTVGDAGNNSVNIKALLTTGCLNEFYKNNIRVNTASVDRSHAYIDSVLFTTIGTAWDCSINIYAVVRSTAACTCYTLYNNKQDASFKKCFEVLSSLPPAPLKCSIPVNGDSVTVLSAPLLINTWKQETSASASFALGCNSYTTLIIGGVNDVRSPTYQKLLISTCITGSENPLNMWIDYMGGYGDKDFITACFSGANCNVIIPMRISSDSQNIYIDLATCTCAARDLCATIYSSCPMPLGSCGNSVRTTCYTASFITDSNCAYCYVMCQWPTTITLNVDDPASQFATRILSANTISAYCMATTSDIRQKKDIVPYNNGLCDISKLDIISFRYKNEDSSCIKHVSIPANWTNPLLSGEKQNQLRINDAVGILLGAVKDLSKSMTLSQKIKLWFYKKFIEPKNNDNIKKKLKDFN